MWHVGPMCAACKSQRGESPRLLRPPGTTRMILQLSCIDQRNHCNGRVRQPVPPSQTSWEPTDASHRTLRTARPLQLGLVSLAAAAPEVDVVCRVGGAVAGADGGGAAASSQHAAPVLPQPPLSLRRLSARPITAPSIAGHPVLACAASCVGLAPSRHANERRNAQIVGLGEQAAVKWLRGCAARPKKGRGGGGGALTELGAPWQVRTTGAPPQPRHQAMSCVTSRHTSKPAQHATSVDSRARAASRRPGRPADHVHTSHPRTRPAAPAGHGRRGGRAVSSSRVFYYSVAGRSRPHLDRILEASVNSPHMAASPPTTRAFWLLLPCAQSRPSHLRLSQLLP